MAKFDAAAHARAEREKREKQLPWHSLAFQTRRAGRVLTRYWNEHLDKPVGIRSTQLDVLAAVKISHNVTVTEIAKLLGLAQCTLSRSLQRLEMNGFVTRIVGTDRRQRWTRLTELGEKALREGTAIIEVPQLRMRTRLTPELLQRIRPDTERIARATPAQSKEESYVRAGLWDADDWEKRWAGWTEEEIFKDRVERARARNQERRDRADAPPDAPAKPPPKKTRKP